MTGDTTELTTATTPAPTQLASSIPTGAIPAKAGDWGLAKAPENSSTKAENSRATEAHVAPTAAATAAAAAAAAEAVRVARPKTSGSSTTNDQDIEDDDELRKLRAQGLTADLIERKKLKMGAPKHLWIAEEDIILASAVAKLGEKCWSEIAVLLPGRVGKQCRDRWRNHLCPFVKKGSWTDREDELLFYHHQQLGNQWAEIAKHIPGRTDLSVKNRYYSYLRKLSRQMARSAKDQANGTGQSKTALEKTGSGTQSPKTAAMTATTGTAIVPGNPPTSGDGAENQSKAPTTFNNRHDPANGISPELELAYKKILGGLATKAPEPLPNYVGSFGSTLEKHLGNSSLGKVAARAKEVVERAVANKAEREAAKKRKKEAKARNSAAKKRRGPKKLKGLRIQTKTTDLANASSALGMLTSLLSANNHEDALESAIAGLTDLATPSAKAGKSGKSRKSQNTKKKSTKKTNAKKSDQQSSNAADLLLGLAQGLVPPVGAQTTDMFSPINGGPNIVVASGITKATPKGMDVAKAKAPVDGSVIPKRSFHSPSTSTVMHSESSPTRKSARQAAAATAAGGPRSSSSKK